MHDHVEFSVKMAPNSWSRERCARSRARRERDAWSRASLRGGGGGLSDRGGCRSHVRASPTPTKRKNGPTANSGHRSILRAGDALYLRASFARRDANSAISSRVCGHEEPSLEVRLALHPASRQSRHAEQTHEVVRAYRSAGARTVACQRVGSHPTPHTPTCGSAVTAEPIRRREGERRAAAAMRSISAQVPVPGRPQCSITSSDAIRRRVSRRVGESASQKRGAQVGASAVLPRSSPRDDQATRARHRCPGRTLLRRRRRRAAPGSASDVDEPWRERRVAQPTVHLLRGAARATPAPAAHASRPPAPTDAAAARTLRRTTPRSTGARRDRAGGRPRDRPLGIHPRRTRPHAVGNPAGDLEGVPQRTHREARVLPDSSASGRGRSGNTRRSWRATMSPHRATSTSPTRSASYFATGLRQSHDSCGLQSSR